MGRFRGLVARMEAMGLGSVAPPLGYTATYTNPSSVSQLHALFGTGVLRAFAAKLNLSPRDLVVSLTSASPRLESLGSAGTSTRTELRFP